MESQLGLNLWALPGMDMHAAAALAQQAGFAAIEPNLDETGEISLTTTAAEATALRAAIERRGLQIGGLSTGLYWRYPPTADDPAIRERARAIAERQLHLAADLGAGAILVVPGQVGAALGGPTIRYDIAYERARDFLRALAPVAERVGVDLAIENVWNKFLLSPLEMRQLVDEVGSERVGVYFDVGNILLYGYPEQWIEILGARIRRIHLKDYDRSRAGMAGFVALGGGDVDWEAVGLTLDQIGYRGPLTAELFPNEDERRDLTAYALRIGREAATVAARMAQGAGR